jgi:Holliday junction resolvase RusA-like endonuclease
MITIYGRPISKKNSKRVFLRGRFPVVISSKAYLKFEQSALEQLKSVKEHYKGEVDVDYVFTFKGKLYCDVDNAIAGVNDILEKAGVLENDRNIKSGTFLVQTGKDWETNIEISPL